MKNSFWDNLPKPFFTLAPMADVTDVAFRELVAKYGMPDFLWTEFVSCDGLLSPGRERLMIDLLKSDNQKPIVAQLFSGNPEKFYECAKLCMELGFDGIDINMGCPDRSIEKQGAGASLINDPARAIECIEYAKKGADSIPVSVKTRTGYNKSEIDEWIPALLSAQPAAITVHARTRKEMSKVPADWSEVARAVELRNEFMEKNGKKKSTTLIVGNGDVKNIDEGRERVRETECDGVMIGRGIFGNPWLFSKTTKKADLSEHEILMVMLEHAELFEKFLGGKKNFAIMRKHFGSYVAGFKYAKELKMALMQTNNAKDVANVVKNFNNR